MILGDFGSPLLHSHPPYWILAQSRRAPIGSENWGFLPRYLCFAQLPLYFIAAGIGNGSPYCIATLPTGSDGNFAAHQDS